MFLLRSTREKDFNQLMVGKVWQNGHGYKVKN